MNCPRAEDEWADSGDYVNFVQDKAIERYEMLSFMKYRNIEMWFSCLCQVWGQQVYSLTLKVFYKISLDVVRQALGTIPFLSRLQLSCQLSRICKNCPVFIWAVCTSL